MNTKPQTLLFALALTALSGCATMAENREQNGALRSEADAVGVAYREKLNAAKPVLIIGHSLGRPNSAGGVNASVQFQNTSDKTIKYLHVRATAINRVGDPVPSAIDGLATTMLTATGPFAPGYVNDPYERWPNAWYNGTASFMRIETVIVEFMDGARVELTGDALAAVQLRPETNDFAAGFQQKRRITMEKGRLSVQRLDL